MTFPEPLVTMGSVPFQFTHSVHWHWKSDIIYRCRIPLCKCDKNECQGIGSRQMISYFLSQFDGITSLKFNRPTIDTNTLRSSPHSLLPNLLFQSQHHEWLCLWWSSIFLAIESEHLGDIPCFLEFVSNSDARVQNLCIARWRHKSVHTPASDSRGAYGKFDVRWAEITLRQWRDAGEINCRRPESLVGTVLHLSVLQHLLGRLNSIEHVGNSLTHSWKVTTTKFTRRRSIWLLIFFDHLVMVSQLK
jgi:hypothetical protein